jgi:hypothetical protein
MQNLEEENIKGRAQQGRWQVRGHVQLRQACRAQRACRRLCLVVLHVISAGDPAVPRRQQLLWDWYHKAPAVPHNWLQLPTCTSLGSCAPLPT